MSASNRDGDEQVSDVTAAGLDSFDLRGRHVVVTGGGRGLGQAIALSAVRCGARVTVVARSANQLEQTQIMSSRLGIECTAVAADLSRTESIDALAGRIWDGHGPIFGVVHAAGVQVRKPATEVTVEDWRSLQAVNMDAAFFLSTAIARRQLSEGSPGSHVFIGSLNSTIGLPRVAPYAASKTALLGLARVMSTEWSGRRVRANVIGPGYFETELTKDLFADKSSRDRVLSRIPMGELGHGRDVGAAAVFLLSDASRYVTGQLLNVDGGWLAS